MNADRETCMHLRADVQYPGSTWRRGIGWRTKYACSDCGAWWITEGTDPEVTVLQMNYHTTHGSGVTCEVCRVGQKETV